MANQDMLSVQGLRTDGRRPDELRSVKMRMEVLPSADGSAYVEQGSTRVIACVYGPHEVRGRSRALPDQVLINCQIRKSSFSSVEHQKRGTDRKSQEMSQHLQEAVEATVKTECFPNSQLDIFVEVLQADGGHFATALNAVSLALVNAGVPVKDLLSCCTASVIRETPIIDICHMERGAGGSELTVAILPKTNVIVFLESSQKYHAIHARPVMDAAMSGCTQIYTIMDQIVRNHTSDVGNALGWNR